MPVVKGFEVIGVEVFKVQGIFLLFREGGFGEEFTEVRKGKRDSEEEVESEEGGVEVGEDFEVEVVVIRSEERWHLDELGDTDGVMGGVFSEEPIFGRGMEGEAVPAGEVEEFSDREGDEGVREVGMVGEGDREVAVEGMVRELGVGEDDAVAGVGGEGELRLVAWDDGVGIVRAIGMGEGEGDDFVDLV